MSPDPSARAAVRPVPAVSAGVSVRLAAAGLVLVALLTAAAYAGRPTLVVAVVLCCAVLAAGWASLLELPSPRGTTTVVALAGVLAAVAVGLTADEPLLEWLAPALAAAVVGEFVHQLGRWDGRPRMVESVCGSVAGVAVLASLASVVALPRSPVGADGVLVWALPVALGVALQALPLPGRTAVPLGVLVAALSGGLLGGWAPAATTVGGAVAAGAAAAVAVMLHRLLVVLPRAGATPGWLALAVAPLAASGLVGYVALRLLIA
ncbi:MAG TPA: hypothetical protein VKB14_06090 [Actinomycetales bacterium]|nr:hypothetical protein [Actinomycetales bacterium]